MSGPNQPTIPSGGEQPAELALVDVTKTFTSRTTPFSPALTITAGVDMSVQVNAGETVALVGESGSGKSTVVRLALRLLQPSSGRVLIGGRDVTDWPERRLRPLRRDIALIEQDPYTCLNPRHSVARILAGPLLNHGLPHGRSVLAGLLESTGLLPEHLDRFPHEFSGGQRQRIAIARALATDPKVIVADEPVSALDVSVRAQVLNLLTELQAQRGLGILIVSHDLSVVRTIADRVVVMQSGRIVEQGPTGQVYADPQQDYTRALLAAVPVPDPHRRRLRASADR